MALATQPVAVLDSGATDTFLTPHDAKQLPQLTNQKGINVTMPNGLQEQAAGTAEPFTDHFSKDTNAGHIMPTFQHSPASVGKICDDDHVVVFDEEKANHPCD